MVVVTDLEAEVNVLALRLDASERENKILREENAMLRKWRFGRSSERLEPGQMHFFETGEEPECAVDNAKEAKLPSGKKKIKGHGRAKFPDSLERIVHRHELSNDERACPACGDTMQAIGEDVTERGRIIPARMVVDRFERIKYACPHGHAVKAARAPDGVIDGGKYGASVYGFIVTAKYQDHQPLNRLEGIFKRYGMRIPKQTMWDMLKRVDELVAQPELKQMRLELLKEPLLHADETSVQLRIEGQKGSRRGWVWGWRNEPFDGPAKVLIEFHQGRGKDPPAAFLGDWSEILLTDGYVSYNPICTANGITRAGCWVHARRYIREALEAGAKHAAAPFQMINRLFALERAIKGRAERRQFDQKELLRLRAEVRARSAAACVKRIIAHAEDLKRKASTLPKSRLGKAVTYLVNQQKPLSTFLSNPLVPIHNNDEERDLRHIVIGRNNWMIFASVLGGEVACRLYSLMLSCRQNGVNPEAYITGVLEAVANTPDTQIASLTPWAWAEKHGVPKPGLN